MNLARLVMPPWLSVGLKLLPWAGWLGTGIALSLVIAGHRVERANWERDKALATAASAKTEAANANRVIAATNTHTETVTRLQPLILNSKAAADAYAQTPAGRAPCLDVDRVRSVLATREALFAFTPARSAGSVSAGPTLPYAALER